MKYTIFLLLNSFHCTPSDSSFYNLIIADRSSCYIAINVSCSDYTGRAVVPNNRLFLYFNEEKGFNREQFKEFITPIITGNLTVSINSSDFVKYDFMKTNPNDTVNKYFKMGIDEFLNHYFTKIEDVRMLSIANKNLTDNEQADVVDILFNWQIASFIDDETGYLMIKRIKTAR